jgi:hypothetical protein
MAALLSALTVLVVFIVGIYVVVSKNSRRRPAHSGRTRKYSQEKSVIGTGSIGDRIFGVVEILPGLVLLIIGVVASIGPPPSVLPLLLLGLLGAAFVGDGCRRIFSRHRTRLVREKKALEDRQKRKESEDDAAAGFLRNLENE